MTKHIFYGSYPKLRSNNAVILNMIIFLPTGEPASERALRGNNSIKILSDEEQEGVREACRVGNYNTWNE